MDTPLFDKKPADLKIRITSRHEELSDSLRADIESRVARLERYMGKLVEAHVVLTYEKKTHTCEITLKGKDHQFAAKANSPDMYKSIEAAFTKLERQTAKVKDKRAKHHDKHSKPLGSVRHGLIAPPEDNQEMEVIKSRKQAVKPMSVEEAALQLAASKDEFLVFHNAESDRTNVVYKRRDHHIGLIEPEY